MEAREVDSSGTESTGEVVGVDIVDVVGCGGGERDASGSSVGNYMVADGFCDVQMNAHATHWIRCYQVPNPLVNGISYPPSPPTHTPPPPPTSFHNSPRRVGRPPFLREWEPCSIHVYSLTRYYKASMAFVYPSPPLAPHPIAQPPYSIPPRKPPTPIPVLPHIKPHSAQPVLVISSTWE